MNSKHINHHSVAISLQFLPQMSSSCIKELFMCYISDFLFTLLSVVLSARLFVCQFLYLSMASLLWTLDISICYV